MSDELEKLRNDVRRLEIQVATLSSVDPGKIARVVGADEQPHAATEKGQRCKTCKYMRMPHRSNAHYTCEVRHTTIEPTWTCGLYYDKKNQRIL
jgi:hypothetical protein